MLTDFINLLFPQVCAACDAILETHEEVLCTDCRVDLPLTNDHFRNENESFTRFKGRLDLQKASSLLYFEKKGPVQEMIHDLKYRGNEKVGELLGAWHASLLKDTLWHKEVDVVIPVPIHQKRKHQRGYNQVKKYAEAFANEFECRMDEKLLIRKSATKTQVFKNRSARTEVSEKNYYLSIPVEQLTSYQHTHFLLVDDILTTGVTLETCAKQLLCIQGAKVSVACMAVTM